MSVRIFYERFGKKAFQETEEEVLRNCLESKALEGNTLIISAGGGLIENARTYDILKKHSNVQIVFLHNQPKILFNRLLKKMKKEHSLPAFLTMPNQKNIDSQIKYAKKKFLLICKKRSELLKQMGHLKVKAKGLNAKKLARCIKKLIF